MLEPIKLEPTSVHQSNPQSPNSQEAEKTKELKKTKKEFKIKRNKNYHSKKHLHDEIFSDPLYAGLQNEDNLNENKHNFGPWVHEDKKHFKPLDFRVGVAEHPDSQQNSHENFFRTTSINQQYFQSQVLTSTNFQENEVNHLPQIKNKRQLHELRYSSLALQLPRHPTLSPLRMERNKPTPAPLKKNQSGMSLDLLRYESTRYLQANDKDLQPRFRPRPSNVIFNYCCFSASENNIFGNDLQQISSQNVTTRGGNLKKNPTSFSLKKRNGLKVEQRDILGLKLETGKMMVGQLKKTISEELYADLIRKKNRRK